MRGQKENNIGFLNSKETEGKSGRRKEPIPKNLDV